MRNEITVDITFDMDSDRVQTIASKYTVGTLLQRFVNTNNIMTLLKRSHFVSCQFCIFDAADEWVVNEVTIEMHLTYCRQNREVSDIGNKETITCTMRTGINELIRCIQLYYTSKEFGAAFQEEMAMYNNDVWGEVFFLTRPQLVTKRFSANPR